MDFNNQSIKISLFFIVSKILFYQNTSNERSNLSQKEYTQADPQKLKHLHGGEKMSE